VQWIPPERLPLALFAGVVVGGEAAVLAGLLMALAGAISVPALFLLALAANVLSDLLWFLSGERLVAFVRRWPPLAARLDRALATVGRVDAGRRCRYLLYYKFVYGLRVATIVFTAMRRVSLRRFAAWNAAGSALYLAALIGGGYVLLRGAMAAAPAAHALRSALAAAVVVVILSRLGAAWCRRRLAAD